MTTLRPFRCSDMFSFNNVYVLGCIYRIFMKVSSKTYIQLEFIFAVTWTL